MIPQLREKGNFLEKVVLLDCKSARKRNRIACSLGGEGNRIVRSFGGKGIRMLVHRFKGKGIRILVDVRERNRITENLNDEEI